MKHCTCTYLLLSLFFIAVNVITIDALPPWIDEVMFADTSYNAAVHGSWATTAWYRVAGQYPFSTYPPLYQMLLTVWIWLFGGSMVVVRSMNLLIMFMLGGVWLRLMRCSGLPLTCLTTALFTVLLWGTGEMAWMYRNGRPDMLCALACTVTIYAIVVHLSAKSRLSGMAVMAASAIALCAGIQAAAYLFVLWLFAFIVLSGRRRMLFRLLGLILSGFCGGLLMVVAFMAAHGRLTAFASSIIQYSDTLAAIALAVLPWAGDVLGFSSEPYVQKLTVLTSGSGLGESLASIVANRSYVVLFIASVTAYAVCFRANLRGLLHDKGALMLLLALSVPVCMSVAGRFAVYYHWMAYLPLLAAIMSIAVRHRSWCGIFGVLAILLTGCGIQSMQPDRQWHYADVRSFVQRHHFQPSDAVVCPFSLFYELKPLCDTCYFVGIFPAEFVGHVDYIIEANTGDAYDLPITDYVSKQRADTSVVLTPVDSCQHPSLTLYQVKHCDE